MARKYTMQEDEFIRSYAYGHSCKEIANEFNKKFSPSAGENQINAYLGNHKITTGRNGRFEKGHVPANKGTHTGGWEPTQFKKGNIPSNHKPVGTVSVRNNYKRNQKYVYVKTAEPNKWRMLHVVNWEKHNGPVPKGKIVIFLDGNQLNTDICNLELIGRNIHARLNQMHLRSNNPDYTKTAINVAQVVVKAGEAKRKLKNRKSKGIGN